MPPRFIPNLRDEPLPRDRVLRLDPLPPRLLLLPRELLPRRERERAVEAEGGRRVPMRPVAPSLPVVPAVVITSPLARLLAISSSISCCLLAAVPAFFFLLAAFTAAAFRSASAASAASAFILASFALTAAARFLRAASREALCFLFCSCIMAAISARSLLLGYRKQLSDQGPR